MSERLTDDEIDSLRHYFDRGAYYFAFDSTGDPDIDLVLGAVCLAGKWYHHTESWGECPGESRMSPVEFIQAAAERAASQRRAEALSAEDIDGLRLARNYVASSHVVFPTPQSHAALAAIDRLIGQGEKR